MQPFFTIFQCWGWRYRKLEIHLQSDGLSPRSCSLVLIWRNYGVKSWGEVHTQHFNIIPFAVVQMCQGGVEKMCDAIIFWHVWAGVKRWWSRWPVSQALLLHHLLLNIKVSGSGVENSYPNCGSGGLADEETRGWRGKPLLHLKDTGDKAAAVSSD